MLSAALAAVLATTLAVTALTPFPARAREPNPAEVPAPAAMQVVALAELPAQAQEAHGRIRTGGPFPYAKDGSVFANRERRLPIQPRGYYREYTVATPGLSNRGARRIVCGGREPRTPDACFYTQDHYASFRRISP